MSSTAPTSLRTRPTPPALQNVTITALAPPRPAVLQAAARQDQDADAGKSDRRRRHARADERRRQPRLRRSPPDSSSAARPGARPKAIATTPAAAKSGQRMYIPTKKLIVHHTATLTNDNPQDPNYPYPAYTADQAVQDIQSIYYYHAITLGWGDIGYNALIDRFGRVFEGRRGRDSGPQRRRPRNHQPRRRRRPRPQWNEGTCGVSCFGNYDVNQIGANEQTNLIGTLVQFLTWSCRRHYVWPNAASDFLQVDWVWRTRHPEHLRPPRRQPDRLPRPVPLRLPSQHPTERRLARRRHRHHQAVGADNHRSLRRRHRQRFRHLRLEVARRLRRRLRLLPRRLDTPTSTPTRTTTSGFTSDKRPDWSILQRRHLRHVSRPAGRPLHLPRPRPRQQERRRLRGQLDLRRRRRAPVLPAARPAAVGVPGVTRSN